MANDIMIVGFKNQKEALIYQTEEALVTLHGSRQAKKIIQRIQELEAADNPQKLPRSARFHEHSGKRRGLFSVDLVHPYRLILLPMCEYESWVEITSVQIYEVMNPH